jgi:tRNA threonylcarbamoyladenosine biosynthesis protein TsaE
MQVVRKIEINNETFEIRSCNVEETFQLGKRFASLLIPGDIVALYGELGSGKTVFVQGACAGLDVQEYVTSPSFTLIHEYSGKIPVYHLDFYRLNSVSEIEDLDLDRYYRCDGVAFIEWAERSESLLPRMRFSIQLSREIQHDSQNINFRHIYLKPPKGRDLTGLCIENFRY